MKRTICTLLLVGFLSLDCLAQSEDDFFNEPGMTDKGGVSAGFGLGLAYGGIGLNISYNVIDRLALFSGLGFNLVGIGFNGGLSYDIIALDKFAFYASVMGGTNAYTKVFGIKEYDKAFFGFSTGTGMKIAIRDKGFLRLGVILPFRNDAFYEAMETISNDSRLEFYSEPTALLITVGFNFIF